MKRFWIIAGMLALAPSGAQAMAVAERMAKGATQAAAEESMTLGQFLMHWDEVQKAGVMARLSPDAGAVTRAVMRGTARYRQMIEADHAAGRPPRSCPLPDTGKLESTDLSPRLKALPVNDHAKPLPLRRFLTAQRIEPDLRHLAGRAGDFNGRGATIKSLR